MKSIKLHTNGSVSVVELEKKKYLFESMGAAIGCDIVDIVEIHNPSLGDQYCLVCDEEFLQKNKPLVNHLASFYYGIKDHGQPLCGDVLVMKNLFTEDGFETVGLEPDDIIYVFERLVNDYEESLRATKGFFEKLGREAKA